MEVEIVDDGAEEVEHRLFVFDQLQDREVRDYLRVRLTNAANVPISAKGLVTSSFAEASMMDGISKC